MFRLSAKKRACNAFGLPYMSEMHALPPAIDGRGPDVHVFCLKKLSLEQ